MGSSDQHTAPPPAKPAPRRASRRKRKPSSNAPAAAATPAAQSATASQPKQAKQAKQVVRPPPSLPASRPLPTEAPPPKRIRTVSSHPEPWAAVDIVERMFSRFAKSQNGVVIGTKTFHTFADAAHPSAPAWPPKLFADFITYYAEHARPRRKGEQHVESKAVFRFVQSVRRSYTRRHGKAVSKEAATAGTVARHEAEKIAAEPRDPRPILTMDEVFKLANAVWSPAYQATFRRRLDVALYMSLALATGVSSDGVFPNAVPGKGYAPGPVFGLTDTTDGARWGDFEVWMTRYGPAAQFKSRAALGRRYTLNDGDILGMAASRLMAMAMIFDGLCGPGCTLAYLLSHLFWGVDGHDARVVAFDQNK